MKIEDIDPDQLRKAATAELLRRDLGFFTELTSGFKLHHWQRCLADRLSQLAHQKGQMLLIHAPPQVGKSQIVSKRLPLWNTLRDRNHRTAIACYNKTKAAEFARVNNLVVEAGILKPYFPDFKFARWSDDAGGYTPERLLFPDAQPSIAAFGIDSGFVGTGCDTLVLDDPYPNAEAARSDASNRSIRSFWEETAEPRLMANADSNVVVMFHRYHEMDIAGYLMTRSDRWELLTFPAIADGDPNDPTGREIGEVLSPKLDYDSLIRKQADDPKTFAGQFQGKPLVEGEKPFTRDMFHIVDTCPRLANWYRGIDTALGDKVYNDSSATCVMAFDVHGNLWIRDFKKARVPYNRIDEWIEREVEKYPNALNVVELQTMGGLVYSYLKRKGYNIKGQEITAKQGGKRARAYSLVDLAVQGKVYIVREGQYEEFLEELLAFTGDPKMKEKDDIIDSVTVVLTYIKESKTKYEQPKTNPTSPVRKTTKQLFSGKR